MVALWILRWFYGSVAFRAEGKHPEHFINAVARSQARLWDVKCKGTVLTARVACADYFSLRPLARRSGMRLRVQRRSGLPFYLRHLRRRPGMVLGAVLFFAVIQCLSLFVWDVQVEGNSLLSREQVLAAAEEMGLKPGTLKRNINLQLVEQGSLARLPEVSWLAVNISGGRADIRLNERDMAPYMVPENEPCNIKARCAGQILQLEAHTGTAMVKEGDGVVEGQLLISAIVEDIHGGSMLKHAAGKVYASVKRTFAAEVPFEQTVTQSVGDPIRRNRLGLFGLDFPVNAAEVPAEGYACEREAKQFVLFGSTLPVFWYTESWTKQQVNTTVLTKEEAEEKAREELQRQIDALAREDVTILEKTERVAFTETGCRVVFDCQCRENIAEESKLEVQIEG